MMVVATSGENNGRCELSMDSAQTAGLHGVTRGSEFQGFQRETGNIHSLLHQIHSQLQQLPLPV